MASPSDVVRICCCIASPFMPAGLSCLSARRHHAITAGAAGSDRRRARQPGTSANQWPTSCMTATRLGCSLTVASLYPAGSRLCSSMGRERERSSHSAVFPLDRRDEVLVGDGPVAFQRKEAGVQGGVADAAAGQRAPAGDLFE